MDKLFLSLLIINSILTTLSTNLLKEYNIPSELEPIKNKIEFHTLKFDPSRVHRGLILTNDLTSVESVSSAYGVFWRSCCAIEGWIKGKHYFHYQIEKGGKYITFGVFDWSVPYTFLDAYQATWHGNDGVSYGDTEGNIHYGIKLSKAFGPILAPYDVVGIYLDLDVQSISFFRNGFLLGSGPKLKTNTTYYPLVSFGSIDAKVNSLKFSLCGGHN